MNRKKLRRLRRQLNSLRRQAKGGIPAKKLETFAKALGRRQTKNKVWESTLLPDSRPLSIHRHAKPVLPFTAGSILDALELDLIALEEKYEDEQPPQSSNDETDENS